jgi:hypothetical protein
VIVELQLHDTFAVPKSELLQIQEVNLILRELSKRNKDHLLAAKPCSARRLLPWERGIIHGVTYCSRIREDLATRIMEPTNRAYLGRLH